MVAKAVSDQPAALNRAWRCLAVAALVLPAVVLFWEIVFAGRVLFWGTPLLQFGPWYRVAVDSIRAGELPLWNPLLGNGAPLLANYQLAAFYPPNWLHLLFEPARVMSWSMVLHVLWAGLGMWFYARQIGLGRFPRLVSVLSFMLSGYLVSRLGFISIGSTLPWLPWLLWSAERLLDQMRVRRAAVLGLCLGLQWLAGHAQMSAYSGLALVGYCLWRVLVPSGPATGPDRSRRAGRLALLFLLALVLGLGLAAIQLLPTAELLQLSQRAAGVERDRALTYSLWPWRLLALLAPRFFGHPATDNYWGYCCNYWEDNGYVGLLPLILALGAGLTWLRTRWRSRLGPQSGHIASAGHEEPAFGLVPFFAAVSLVSLVLAFGVHTPIYPFLFDHLPGFDQFQAPARWLALWTLGISVLAGVGAQLWRPTARLQQVARYAVVVGLALVLAAGGARFVVTGDMATAPVGLVQLGAGLVVSGLLAIRQPRRESGERQLGWAALVLLFVALDLVSADWGANPTTEPWLYQRPTRTASALRQADVERIYYPAADEYRVTWDNYLSFRSFGPRGTDDWLGLRETLLPNMSVLDGVSSANNFDPLQPARHVNLLAAIEAAPRPTQLKLLRAMSVQALMTADPQPDLEPVHASDDVHVGALLDSLPRAYLVYDALEVASPQEALEAVVDPSFDPAKSVVLEGRAPALPSGTALVAESVTLTSTFTSATIRAGLPEPGYLVLADTYYPGWQAVVDGRPEPVLPADGAFRAVALSAGVHEVLLLFRPTSLRLGAYITMAGWLILIACWVVGGDRSRDTVDPERQVRRFRYDVPPIA